MSLTWCGLQSMMIVESSSSLPLILLGVFIFWKIACLFDDWWSEYETYHFSYDLVILLGYCFLTRLIVRLSILLWILIFLKLTLSSYDHIMHFRYISLYSINLVNIIQVFKTDLFKGFLNDRLDGIQDAWTDVVGRNRSSQGSSHSLNTSSPFE